MAFCVPSSDVLGTGGFYPIGFFLKFYLFMVLDLGIKLYFCDDIMQRVFWGTSLQLEDIPRSSKLFVSYLKIR